MKIKAIIFDMDGLLFDTERLGLEMWKKACTDYNLTLHDSVYLKVIGSNLIESEKIFKKELGKDFPFHEIRKIRFKYTDKYIKDFGIPLKEGVFELLDYLKNINVICALATSTNKEKANKLLTDSGLIKYFNIRICGNEVQNSKPHPEIFIKVLNKLKLNGDECFVIEDSNKGITAAFSAGIHPIMIPDMLKPTEDIKKKCYVIFDSLLNVKDFLKKQIFV